MPRSVSEIPPVPVWMRVNRSLRRRHARRKETESRWQHGAPEGIGDDKECGKVEDLLLIQGDQPTAALPNSANEASETVAAFVSAAPEPQALPPSKSRRSSRLPLVMVGSLLLAFVLGMYVGSGPPSLGQSMATAAEHVETGRPKRESSVPVQSEADDEQAADPGEAGTVSHEDVPHEEVDDGKPVAGATDQYNEVMSERGANTNPLADEAGSRVDLSSPIPSKRVTKSDANGDSTCAEKSCNQASVVAENSGEPTETGTACSDAGRTLGTALTWSDSPATALEDARGQEKLVFLMHVSGNFERPGFT